MISKILRVLCTRLSAGVGALGRPYVVRLSLVIFSAVIFFSVSLSGYSLLISDELSGAEFVTLIIAFAGISFMVAFATEIQELSIGGNVIKLRQIRQEAEDAIVELNRAKIENVRFLLRLATRHPGGWGRQYKDDRVGDLIFLCEIAHSINCFDELSEDLEHTLRSILLAQAKRLSVLDVDDRPPKPSELNGNLLEVDPHNQPEFNEAIKGYENLYRYYELAKH